MLIILRFDCIACAVLGYSLKQPRSVIAALTATLEVQCSFAAAHCTLRTFPLSIPYLLEYNTTLDCNARVGFPVTRNKKN